MNTVLQHNTLSLKSACVNFMFAYQQKNLDKMLSFCNSDGMVEFVPLGKDGIGKIGELGKTIWGALIDSFPDLDNTVDATITEEQNQVRCQVVIRGTQHKDFAGIQSKGKHFDSDHIFIFRLNDNNLIDHIRISWDHEDFKKQLSA